MTIAYRVMTKHTKEMLMDFVNFTYKVKYPKSGFRLCVIGVGCILLALYAARFRWIMYVSAAIGGFLIAYAFMRPFLAFNRLAANDKLYTNQTEIKLDFGESVFAVKKENDKKETSIGYGQISTIYKDKKNYFLGINNEDMQILPYRDFETGEAAAFEDFIKGKTKKKVINLNRPLRERLHEMNETRKELERQHDEKIERNRQEKLNKK